MNTNCIKKSQWRNIGDQNSFLPATTITIGERHGVFKCWNHLCTGLFVKHTKLKHHTRLLQFPTYGWTGYGSSLIWEMPFPTAAIFLCTKLLNLRVSESHLPVVSFRIFTSCLERSAGGGFCWWWLADQIRVVFWKFINEEFWTCCTCYRELMGPNSHKVVWVIKRMMMRMVIVALGVVDDTADHSISSGWIFPTGIGCRGWRHNHLGPIASIASYFKEGWD